MKVRVEFSLLCRDERVVAALYGAVEPDNIGLPDGLRMEMRCKGRRLKVDISSEARFETLTSTIDDLLESLQISMETLSESEAG